MKRCFKICFYVIPSVVVFLICLGLHNSGFSNYLKSHTYQCRVIGGEKTEGGYKRSGHMYLILQDVNSNRIFSINASPEEMASTLMIATLILLGTSILSYNFVI
jgi:hypothetical protein